MTIQWLIASTFLIQTKSAGGEIALMTDPLKNAKIPKTEAHIILISDHSGLSLDSFPFLKASEKTPLMIDTPGEYERGGVSIYGIQETDTPPLHTLYLCESEGISILYIGPSFAQGQFTSEQMERMGNVDMMLLPLGTKVLGGAKAAALVHQLEPRIVIGSCIGSSRVEAEFDDEKEFVKKTGLTPITESKLKITKKELPQEETRFILLESQG